MGLYMFEFEFTSANFKNGYSERIDSEDPVALSHVCIPSIHVSGMVAASCFTRAAVLIPPPGDFLRCSHASSSIYA